MSNKGQKVWTSPYFYRGELNEPFPKLLKIQKEKDWNWTMNKLVVTPFIPLTIYYLSQNINKYMITFSSLMKTFLELPTTSKEQFFN